MWPYIGSKLRWFGVGGEGEKKQSGLLSGGKQTHMHTSLYIHVIYVSIRSVDHHLPSIHVLTVGHQLTCSWGHGSALSFKVTECLCVWSDSY